MEEFIRNNLAPTETCTICCEPFSEGHAPVALQCAHIFGHGCFTDWLRNGDGNTNSCPLCRAQLFEETVFHPYRIWGILCQENPQRLCEYMKALWQGIQRQSHADPGNGQTLVQNVIWKPLWEVRDPRNENCTFRRYVRYLNDLSPQYGVLNPVDEAIIPILRLSELLACVYKRVPLYLTTSTDLAMLVWKANQSIGVREGKVNWSLVCRAARDLDGPYFPLLHLYTVLISQYIIHGDELTTWPTKRHEKMNYVVQNCCTMIGSSWTGYPTNHFKDQLIVVYEELRRHQKDTGRISLRGTPSEGYIVKGLWSLAGNWQIKRTELR
ncbi:hypothetical protein BU24DRAFT_359074 [Aaosphaeria arxii CBS 175.79]|uniref:RING-type domain-containing protein n=1 Tax=Aaosphaeria arxii CBS 175.79 TaxID=1450172 RepID=A0A6A5X7R9_9PLEO|nr:uncharacterized protein BU24DRAFT_359074 [Aaosphaeria arxii CBS 175.79]KAF2008946.1 hypothetical protein BU24DRAFT_359074 [Aaosphaeria arxii CBS 175.79]